MKLTLTFKEDFPFSLEVFSKDGLWESIGMGYGVYREFNKYYLIDLMKGIKAPVTPLDSIEEVLDVFETMGMEVVKTASDEEFEVAYEKWLKLKREEEKDIMWS